MSQLIKIDNLLNQLSDFKSISKNKADDSSQQNCKTEFAAILQGEIITSPTSQSNTTVNSEFSSIPFEDRPESDSQPIFFEPEGATPGDIDILAEITIMEQPLQTESRGKKTESGEQQTKFHLPISDFQLQQQFWWIGLRGMTIFYLPPKETENLALNSRFKSQKSDEATDVSALLKPGSGAACIAENQQMWNTPTSPDEDGAKTGRQSDVRWFRLPGFRHAETAMMSQFIQIKPEDSFGVGEHTSSTPHPYTSYLMLTEASNANEVLEQSKQQAEYILYQLKEPTEKIIPTEETISAEIEFTVNKSPKAEGVGCFLHGKKIGRGRWESNNAKPEATSDLSSPQKSSDGVAVYPEEVEAPFRRLTWLIRPAGQNAPLSYTSSTTSAIGINVITQIGREIDRTNIRLEELRVQLKPEHLGSVTLKASMMEGVLSVDISTENAIVKSIIESHSHHLKQLLSQQGIEVGQFNVSAESNTPKFGSQWGTFSSDVGDSRRNAPKEQSNETLEQENWFVRRTAIDVWM